jgi:carotenoid cleavage dioxygenase-like enzyme
MQTLSLGPHCTFQEPQFVPTSANEDEGYLLAAVNYHDTNLASVVVLDAKDISKGPLASLHFPFRLRAATHGNWVKH